jgi:hypothetical protein
MVRISIYLLMLALAVSLISALVHFLLIAGGVVIGGLLMVFLFRCRRAAFWSLVAIAGLYLLTKIGPWGLAAIALWLVVEAYSALRKALR